MLDLFSEQVLGQIVGHRVLAKSHVANLIPVGDGALFCPQALLKNLGQIVARLRHLKKLTTRHLDKFMGVGRQLAAQLIDTLNTGFEMAEIFHAGIFENSLDTLTFDPDTVHPQIGKVVICSEFNGCVFDQLFDQCIDIDPVLLKNRNTDRFDF